MSLMNWTDLRKTETWSSRAFAIRQDRWTLRNSSARFLCTASIPPAKNSKKCCAMPPESFLHERNDFQALIETVAENEKIHDPALVEKDYWIMHALFGLKQLGLSFELKGGTSLSKGFGIVHRFSEDIDVRIEPFDGLHVDTNPSHTKPAHIE